jgi:tRNA1(Val) A37 N6-methylase TrmN6
MEPRGKVLDVGCGVGILGLLTARDFDVEMSVIDKQKYMTDYAMTNYRANNLPVEVHTGDFGDFGDAQKYDYIISNPPFYDSAVTQSQDERTNMARYAHHLPLEILAEGVKRLLKPRGYFVFCYDAKQIDKVFHCLRIAKLNPEIVRFVHPKADREAKIALVSARSNSRSMTRVLPPLVVFDEENNYLPDAQAAFDLANTHVISADKDIR